jgi:adenylate kinase
MRVIFLGPPGVGKGTQSKKLSESHKVAHIATGDILREAVKNGTPIGLKAKSFMDKGELVPDAVVIGIIEERFQRPDVKAGFVLDGFPRTVAQAEALNDLLTRMRLPIEAVMYFDAADEVIVERISGRRTCKKCGAPYHMKFMPPKKAGVCDRCSGELEHRTDDQEDKVRNRLKVYKAQTAELISYYSDRKLLHKIDGARPPDEIFRSVQKIVDGLKR